ncbi:MAG: YgiQ family radical SAM protein [Spirochaetes bacterium]|nr:YgiQ family radical SAM protein [Spirochaetota bacterium]
MFIPTTREEAVVLGWERFDVILITGDAYIDSPFLGPALIGHVLMDAGYRVGIIAQPDVKSGADVTRLGEPLLFWGVSSGSVDSLVSNYTASGKRRMQDDLTPGGRNDRRPDRAVIVYSNLIREHFKNTAPIVIGGIEAGMRRIAHYDFYDDRVRRSILFDAKADILVYGMGERPVLELADCLKKGRDYRVVRGICHISGNRIDTYIELPSYERVLQDKREFVQMSRLFIRNTDPVSGRGMIQMHGNRYLVHNPPAVPLTSDELDRVYELPYERSVHPFYKKMGEVRALGTIQFSITTHRGCFGGCSFCSISVHQGSAVVSRSEASIIREAKSFTRHREFKGIIADIGGPTANMYGMLCKSMLRRGLCADKRCAGDYLCKSMSVSHKSLISLLGKIRKLPGVRKAFVASGIRHDLVLADHDAGEQYLSEILRHHVSGQLKIAPEHCVDRVLDLMGKPSAESLIAFRDLFNRLNRQVRKKQFLTYYLIAAHPGCTLEDMKQLRGFTGRELRLVPEQVQIFTALPSTLSTVMYYTGVDPSSGEKVFVERDVREKERQKRVVTGPGRRKPPSRKNI